MDTAYRVRYQAHPPQSDRQSLFIEDTEGMLYLFSGGRLQCRLDPQVWWPRISAFMDRAHYAYSPVENDNLYSLDSLRCFDRAAS